MLFTAILRVIRDKEIYRRIFIAKDCNYISNYYQLKICSAISRLIMFIIQNPDLFYYAPLIESTDFTIDYPNSFFLYLSIIVKDTCAADFPLNVSKTQYDLFEKAACIFVRVLIRF
jgi:hypothetical protein